MSLRFAQYLLLAANLMLTGIAQCSEDLVTGQNYYVIQLASGSFASVHKNLQVVKKAPYARVEKRGQVHMLRIGFWDSQQQAKNALPSMLAKFPSAFVRTAEYRPQDIVSDWKPDSSSARINPIPQANTGNVIAIQSTAQQNIVSVTTVDSVPLSTSQAATAPTPPPSTTSPTTPALAASDASAVPEKTLPAAASSKLAQSLLSLPSVPDEAALWKLLEDNQLDPLQQTIDHLRIQQPSWQAPADLLGLLQQAKMRRDIERAIAANDDNSLIKLADDHAAEFGCAHIDRAWALGNTYSRLARLADAESLAQRLLSNCDKEQDRLATLYKSRGWLAPTAWERLLDSERPIKRSSAGEEAYAKLRYDYQLEKLVTANKTGDQTNIQGLFTPLTDEIKHRQDVGAAMIGAWNNYQLANYAGAIVWFEQALIWDALRHEARQGIALSQLKQKDYAAAYASAEALPEIIKERSELLSEARLGQAQLAYDAKDYSSALRHLEDASRYATLPLYASLLRGWSLFQLGQYDKAGDVFTSLYQAEADQQSAEGVLNSLVKANRFEALAALAVNEPLSAMLNNYYANKWFNEKRFLAAKQKAPELFNELGAIATPRVTALGWHREKSGTKGLSQLSQTVTGVEVAYPISPAAEVRLKLEHVELDNGVYEAKGWQPSIEWQYESPSTTYNIQAGLTPTNAPVSPRLVGDASLARYFLDGNYKIAAYMRPVKESFLSYTGDTDHLEHGQVVRNGIELSGAYALSEHWRANTKLALERLTGQKVLSNDHVAIDTGMAYGWKPDGFDYVALSFGLGYDHYSHNLSQFTIGHGGYFSPQQYWHWGPSLDFLTAENRNFILKGHLGVGGLYKKEEDTPVLPLSNSVERFNGSQGTGKSYNADIQGVWRINDYTQIGGSLVKRYAPEYSDFSGFGFLRFLFEPRKSVLRADLPGGNQQYLFE